MCLPYSEKKREKRDDLVDSKPHRRTRNLLCCTSKQVTCGPITAKPVTPPTTATPPAKGKLSVPLTRAEKEHNRLVKANSYKNGGVGKNGTLVGGGGATEDQEPVDFMHLKTWGRNYAVLQVSLV